ncbi:RNA-binding S4 domain-containing protein [Parasphingorhabdus sp.]|uniref:RNA-binding S4 domain-containing protein n=1 Tax=Parasphingorhabdus sp. TaxID=2709688 RepID=UPI003593C8F5
MSGREADRSHAALPVLRIDKLLWFLRFAQNRVMARKLAEKGHVRMNGRRIERGHVKVRQGDILTIPQGQAVQVVRIIALPERRSSASQAQSCYEILQTGI